MWLTTLRNFVNPFLWCSFFYNFLPELQMAAITPKDKVFDWYLVGIVFIRGGNLIILAWARHFVWWVKAKKNLQNFFISLKEQLVGFISLLSLNTNFLADVQKSKNHVFASSNVYTQYPQFGNILCFYHFWARIHSVI